MTVLRDTKFRAMGTDIEILAYPELPLHVVDQVQARFSEIERTLSRFLPESELSRLNGSDGEPFPASATLREVLGGALDAARRSGGIFDPTLLYAVEAAGYTRPFEDMSGMTTAREPEVLGSYGEVEIRGDGTIVLHNGVRVDLGGYAKGWTVDSCGELLTGCPSWVVNAGGDLRAHGLGLTGEGWLVGIEDPFDAARDVGVLLVTGCAVATSSKMRRRWTTQTGVAHHIIDPATRRPAETGLASVTVIAPTSAEAEVLAKVLFLLGPRQGWWHVEDSPDVGAVFVLDDGSDLWTENASGLRVS